MKPRVILIRENPETLTCSNCAGSLEGIDAFGTREVPDYASIRGVMDQVGKLYMSLRREFGDQVLIDVVDPRNAIYLIPTLIGDFFKYHPPLGCFLRTLFLGVSPASVIVNGTVLQVGALPSPGHLVQRVGSFLRDSRQPQP